MPLDLGAVGRGAGPVEVSWTSQDALLYALGVGAGQDDPLGELAFTTENTRGVPQQVLPTFALVLGQRAQGLWVDLGDFDRTRLLHAEQELTLSGPLPVEGRARLTATVTGIFDKGSGALAVTSTTADDPVTGQRLFNTRSAVFIRGEGGFGGDRGPRPRWPEPSGAPGIEVGVETRPDQALLYRLSGDRNPLHSDPSFASLGGFPRPILHGLCTYGITARVLLRALCDGDPAGFGSITGRFTRPVLPGEKLTVSAWPAGDGRHLFRTTDSTGAVVIDQGFFAAAGSTTPAAGATDE
jgi:acyl dehydratase